jgi:hypothetical protein
VNNKNNKNKYRKMINKIIIIDKLNNNKSFLVLTRYHYNKNNLSLYNKYIQNPKL